MPSLRGRCNYAPSGSPSVDAGGGGDEINSRSCSQNTIAARQALRVAFVSENYHSSSVLSSHEWWRHPHVKHKTPLSRLAWPIANTKPRVCVLVSRCAINCAATLSQVWYSSSPRSSEIVPFLCRYLAPSTEITPEIIDHFICIAYTT